VKRALITGITGQDGRHLSQSLADKGYQVFGLVHGQANPKIEMVQGENPALELLEGDLRDLSSLIAVVEQVQPDEIYNLGAQSHVQVSFETPEYTANADGIGMLRILEAIRILGLVEKVRVYQASTSELYGLVQEVPQRETTPFYPRSPYGVAKLYAYWILVNYREAYGLHASNGILFNHESPLRGETFVTRKISRAVAAIELGLQDRLYMGNLDALRDWGHARDYVRGMWMMLQQDQPDDYVLATGENHSIREFVERAFGEVGRSIEWSGRGLDEIGRDARTGQALVAVDPRYFRPTEVEQLIGDPSKANQKLGWRHEVGFEELVREMVASDLETVKRDSWRRSPAD
jgi:GDPmannose 4,6-dehydratase